MFGTGHRARRFTLLLLEEGEDYVGDWVASLAGWPAGAPGGEAAGPATPLPGRLRLASRSLFFEADDARVPVVRLPLAAVLRLEPVGGTGGSAFEVVATAVTRMKAHAADGPYEFDRFEGDRSGLGGGGSAAASATATLGPPPAWRFSLPYAPLEAVLPTAHTYLAASRLPHAERGAALAQLAGERVAAASFDLARLADFGEALAWEGPARLAGPLTSQAGRLALTDARLYWQPLDDLDGGAPVRSHALARVGAVAKRRAGLRPLGLEVFFLGEAGGGSGGGGGGGGGGAQHPDRAGSWGAPSALFTFPSPAARDALAAALARAPALGTSGPGGSASAASQAAAFESDAGIAAVTSAWADGRVSNLDYLLFLNLAAGRSFADVTQYPVVPWVLADFTSPTLNLTDPASYRDLSKPMGALHPARLATLRERMAHMPPGTGVDAPFLYGTHYSCPGYVLFWLVRAAPAHMLRLQAGRFDAPDRLFASIAESWASASSSPADVKELIPEFYLGDPSFLVNGAGLALGRRQDGRPVDDVALPAWVPEKGGATERAAGFLRMHRAALESPVVSANLHHWVDLVFGWKARGHAAAAADNLFHPLTYADSLPADLDAAFPDARDRAALEVQVAEFGQCPRQLFTAPHPRRRVCPAWDGGGGGSSSSVSSTTAPAALALAVLATVGAAVDEGGSWSAADGPGPPALPPGAVGPDALAALDVLPVEAGPGDEAVAAAAVEEVGQGLAAAALSDGGRPAKAAAAAAATAAAPPRAAAPPPPPPPPLPPQPPQPQPAPSPAARLAGAAVGVLAGAAAAATGAAAETGGGLSSTLRGLFGGGGGGGGSGARRTSSAGGGGLPSAGPWGAAAASRLAALAPTPPTRVSTLAGGVSGLAAARGLGTDVVAYAVGPAGVLQSASVDAGARLRSAPLCPGVPLSCLALLPGGGKGGGSRPAHLTALAGGQDGVVHAYQPAVGAAVGGWAAHTDAVTAAVVVVGGSGGGGSGARLATSSWDGTVRLWALDGPSPPWAPGPGAVPTPLVSYTCPPAAAPGDAPPGVWALAVEAGLALAGTEAGGLYGWDARSPPGSGPAVSLPALVPGGDYVAGLALAPVAGRGSSGPPAAVAACGDGRLRLVDLRGGGLSAAVVAVSPPAGAPLRCVASDGSAAVAGTEDGRLVVWDVSAASGGEGSSGSTAALLPALTVSPGHAVTSCTAGVPGGKALVVLAGDEGGGVSVFRG